MMSALGGDRSQMPRFTLPALVSATLLSAILVLASPRAQAAEPSLPPFYQSVTAMKPQGKLGEVVAKEPVATAIPGARAWRIAYLDGAVPIAS